MLDRRLFLHLASWLGQWPAGPGLHVVRSHRRARPAWDGRLRPAVAVTAAGCTILSVPPDRVDAVRAVLRGRGLDKALLSLPRAVGSPEFAVHTGRFRWSTAPAPLPDVGEWTLPAGPDLPPWLWLFDREVLVVRDADGRYLAGAGIKRHDAYGHELAVGVVPAAWGRGLARRLVAQAARRVLTTGRYPPTCTTSTTTPRPGWPTRPASRTGAGPRSGSSHADRTGRRGPWIPGRIHGPQPLLPGPVVGNAKCSNIAEQGFPVGMPLSGSGFDLRCGVAAIKGLSDAGCG